MKKKVKKLTSIHQSKQNAWIEPHSMSNRKRNGMEIKYSMVRKEESKDKVLNNKKPSRVRRKIASHYGLAQMVKNLPAMQETRFNPWIRKIPWRSEWLPTPILLPGEFHGQRSLVGYSPWGRRVRQLSDPHSHCR